MAKASTFWDRIAERYSKQPVADEVSYQKKLEIIREYLKPDMDVFEFGCGTGSTALALAAYVKHIHAIDISGRMIEIAQQKADAAAVTNVRFEQAGIEELGAASGRFDAVLGMSILHLVADKEAVLSQVHEILKPGGVFVSSTACISGIWKLVALIAPIGRIFGFLPLLRVFSISELERSIVNAGFKIEHQWQPKKGSAVFIVATKPS